jgi:hypothetical protein
VSILQNKTGKINPQITMVRADSNPRNFARAGIIGTDLFSGFEIG